MSILRIGILQTDSVLEKFQPKFGDYPLMFERVLQSSARLPDAADIRVRIPIRSAVDSLNVATAAAIAFSHDPGR